MRTYRYRSEGWYCDVQPLWMRLLRWLVSTGWSAPDWSPAGYSYRSTTRRSLRLALRARGHRSRLYAVYDSLCPLSLFGGRLTFQPFGVSWYSRRASGWYCLTWRNTSSTCHAPLAAYRSHNATPWGADTWYLGAPRDIIAAAQAESDQRAARHQEVA